MKAGTPQPIFMKAIEISGNQEIDVRKVEITPVYTQPPWLVDEFTSLMTDIYEEYDQIYMDGLLKDDMVRFAIVINNQIIKKRMRSQSWINSAEQQAIITAIESTTITNKPMIIADSLSSLLAASGNRWTLNPKKRNIRRLLDHSSNHIKLIWVPSHVGICGSEAADQAAKEALNEDFGNQEPNPPQDLMKWKKKGKKDGKKVKTIWNIGSYQ
jgi:ribonuclease HI